MELSAALTDPLNVFNVTGKSALITGASGAFGRVAAVTLGACGANLTLVSGTESDLEETRAAVEAVGGRAQMVLRRPDTPKDAQAMVDAALAAYGGVDILVVASGYNRPGFIHEMDVTDWEAVMDVNVRGAWLMSQAAGRHMIERGGGGKVVFVSSVRGRHGNYSGYTGYCTSKAATDGLTRVLATEWGAHGINVNAVAPTVFRSKLTAWMFGDDKLGRETRERSFARIPLKRLGEPEDFIGIILYLCSAASDFCTGQVLYIDGGYTAG